MTAIEKMILNGLGVNCKQVGKTKFVITSEKTSRQSIVDYSYNALNTKKSGWIAIVESGREIFTDRKEALQAAAKYVANK